MLSFLNSTQKVLSECPSLLVRKSTYTHLQFIFQVHFCYYIPRERAQCPSCSEVISFHRTVSIHLQESIMNVLGHEHSELYVYF
jgi:hypothetical protein